jgi:hypothetical protein
MLRLSLAPLLALSALGGCAPAQAPRLLPPRSAEVARPSQPRVPVAPAPPASALPTPSLADVAEPVQAATVAPPPEPPPLRVVIEAPYSALGHPRLATEMATLERDEELFQWALGGSSDPDHPANRPSYHPSTRVVVDVRLLSRAPQGSARRLERIARSTGYWPLRACFEQAQRSAPKAERQARVRLSLGASGKLLGARLLEGPPERDYARCVVERLRKLDFSPGFSRRLDAEISVKQWPGHAPVPPRAPENAPRLRPSAALRASLEALTPKLEACYRTGVERDPKLWGRLALRLELDAGGVVEAAREVETRFPDAAVVECVRQSISGAELAADTDRQLTLAVRFAQGAAPAPPSTLGIPPAPAPPESTPPAPPEGAPPAPPAPH